MAAVVNTVMLAASPPVAPEVVSPPDARVEAPNPWGNVVTTAALPGVASPGVPAPSGAAEIAAGVWIRAGGAVVVRQALQPVLVVSASGGLFNEVARTGVSAAATSAGDLQKLDGERTMRQAEAGVGAWLSLSKGLEVGSVFSAASYRFVQDDQVVAVVLIPALSAEANYTIPARAVMIIPGLTLSRDLRETQLSVGNALTGALSPWSARVGLTIAPSIR